LIRFFSVKRVPNYCRIKSVICTCTCFFFQSVLLQPLGADLVRTNNKINVSSASPRTICNHPH